MEFRFYGFWAFGIWVFQSDPAEYRILWNRGGVLKTSPAHPAEQRILQDNGSCTTADPGVAALVYLTDLEASQNDFGDKPHYPVLWVTTSSEEAPYGEVIKM